MLLLLAMRILPQTRLFQPTHHGRDTTASKEALRAEIQDVCQVPYRPH